MNSNLLGPLQSETFNNNAADSSGRFYSDQRPVTDASATSTSMTISYDATTQSYTVSTAGRSATFSSADQVNSGSTDFVAYEKSNGSLHQSLALTKPGTSGALLYKYVGGGAWERADVGTTTLDFNYNPFTYGAATSDVALQRSGTGTYSVSLVGARSADKPYSMAGTGTMQVDFLNGQLASSGVLTSIDVSTGIISGLGLYYGSATISSTLNAFGGTFSMDDGSRFTGGWEGRFYGPSNEEVGAVWHISSTDGNYAAGYLIGRQDSGVLPVNTTIAPLQFSETFATRTSEMVYKDNGAGKVGGLPYLTRYDATLAFDASSGTWRYVDDNAGIDSSFTTATVNSSKSNSAITVYEMTGTDGIGYRLTLNKPGSGNTDIALSYASFGHWEQAQSVSADARDRWFAWGVRTNGFQIPTGTGHYDGILKGTGASMSSGKPIYTLSGTASFDLDFGAATFTGALHPTGTSMVDGSSRDFGNFTIVSGVVDADAGLQANISNANSDYLGYFNGALYGPTASEIGGAFGFQTETTTSNSNSATAAILNGAIIGKRTN